MFYGYQYLDWINTYTDIKLNEYEIILIQIEENNYTNTDIRCPLISVEN